MLECAKTGDRSGLAWQKVLERFLRLEFVMSDAAFGIAAGVKAVRQARGETAVLLHGLDVFHTSQGAQRVLGCKWRRAESAWDEAVEASAHIVVVKRRGQDSHTAAQQERARWNNAKRQFGDVEKPEAGWQRIRAALSVFQPDGKLNERSWAEAEINAALAALAGPEWRKLRNYLKDRRSLVFVDRMHQRLVEAVPETPLREACVHRWWLRHQRPVPLANPLATAGQSIEETLDERIRTMSLSATEQAAYERVSAVLRTTVRASSAVEGINSVLRMQQGRHRRMTQGLLDLKRLYWNCRQLKTGKRKGHCPYELLGAKLPSTEFWVLLQTPMPELRKRAQELSTQQLPE